MPLLGDILLKYIPRAIRKTGEFEELGVEGWPSVPTSYSFFSAWELYIWIFQAFLLALSLSNSRTCRFEADNLRLW